MKCYIQSWGLKEVECSQNPIGDCSNCQVAWNYMSLVGPGMFAGLTRSIVYLRDGQELVAKVIFADGDPKMYTYTIKNGVYGQN